jgi:hypothetical protein
VVDDDPGWIERLLESTERTLTQVRNSDTDRSRRLAEELEALRDRLAAKLQEPAG